MFKQRRRVIVDKRIQFRFALFCIGYLILSHFLLSVSLFGPLFKKLEDPGATSGELFQAATHTLYLHAHFWPIVLLSILCVSLPVILLSRRFVGPISRFTAIFDKLRDGHISKPFVLRKNDYLDAELEVINGMLENLRLRLGGIQEDHVRLQSLLEKLKAEIPRQDVGSLTDLNQQAMEVNAELGRKIDHFDVER